jgi:hypothetical protein
MGELLFEIIFVGIIGYTVAFIRWMFVGFKKGKFEEYLKTDWYVSLFYFAALCFLISLIYKAIK